jgi:hypothetical protein
MSTMIYSDIIKNSRHITSDHIPLSDDTFGPYAMIKGPEAEHKKVSQ